MTATPSACAGTCPGTQTPALRYFFWECTRRCNLSCRHCGSECSVDAAIPDPDPGLFYKALRDIASGYDPASITVCLTGGEPLLRRDIRAIGRRISAQGYYWGMVTNGTLLSRKRLDSLIDAGISTVSISIDGFRETHEWLRSAAGSYGRTLAAVRACAASSLPDFDVITCVHRNNVSELEALYRFFSEAGIPRWRLYTIFPAGRAARHHDLRIDADCLKTLLEFVAAKRSEKGAAMDVSCSCMGHLGSYQQQVSDSHFRCEAGLSVASLLADNSISACPSLRSGFAQGDALRENVLDVWENGFRIMREKEWMRTDGCAGCDAFSCCAGGPLHLRDPFSKALSQCHYRDILQGHFQASMPK